MTLNTAGTDSERGANFPMLTVVVPALNERAFIGSTLEQLLSQQFPGALEILVIDGGSDDGTVAIVEQLIALYPSTLRLLHNPLGRASGARNIGVRHARGEFILFVDAHVFIPREDLLFRMVQEAQSRNARILARPQPLNAPGLSHFQQAVAAVRALPLGHSRESYIFSHHRGWISPLSAGTMYHRSVFSTIGMFDQRFDAAEDLDFNYRAEQAGWKAFIAPEFAVHYHPRSTPTELFRQMVRYGQGRTAFTLKHPQRFRAELLAPVILAMLLLSLPWLVTFVPGLGVPLLSSFGVGGLGVMVGAGAQLHTRWLRPALMAPFVLALIHLGLAWGVVTGIVNAHQPRGFIREHPCSEKRTRNPRL